jgi:hypothetical protein
VILLAAHRLVERVDGALVVEQLQLVHAFQPMDVDTA